MAITQSESGLDSVTYTSFIAEDDNPKWTVEAYKYNLDFAEKTPAQSFINLESDDWDACQSGDGDFFVMYSQGDLFVFLEDVEDVSTPPKVATGLTNSAKSPSVVEESNVAYIFTYNGTNIVRTEYSVTTSGAVYSTNSTMSPSLSIGEELTHLCAATKDRLHFVVKDSNNLYHLRVATWSASISESNIYYMYPIQNLSVATDGTKDVIVMATQVPGTVSVRVVNDEVEKYIEAAGGVICFIYENGNWSDHFEIDTVDNANDWRMRRGPRITYMNGLFVNIAYSVAGTERFPFATYRIYTSKNGKHWSLGQIVPIDTTPDRRGMKLVPVGDHVILCESRGVYESWSTDIVGYTPTSLIVDITDDIDEYIYTQDKGAQVDIKLDNSDGAYTDHAIINGQSTIMLVHKAGFGTDLIQIAITEVDYLSYDGEPTNQIIQIVARDRMAWISDKTQSEEAKYWEGQLVGADRYQDLTKTHYGGMRHTATQLGSWDSVDSMLQLRSNNEQGVSFNTFKSYIWNGSYQADFRLATLNNDEYAGIVFRAIDKDNRMEARYDETTDTIKIIETLGGNETILATSSSMGWDNLSWHYLKVEFRYAKIVVLTSGDGVTWSTAITYYQAGQHTPGTYGPILLDIGYVGHVARGYSPPIESDWNFPEFVIPDYIWTPPNFDLDTFEIDFAVDTSVDGDQNYAIAVDKETGTLVFTENFTTIEPTWADKSPAHPTLYACFGAKGISNVEAWAFTHDGSTVRIYNTNDVLATSPTWSIIHSFSETGTIFSAKIDYHKEFDVLAYSYETATLISTAITGDDGSSWNYRNIVTTSHSKVGDIHPSFILAPNGTEPFYIYFYYTYVGGRHEYIPAGLSVSGGVYDDDLLSPAGSETLPYIISYMERSPIVNMGPSANTMRDYRRLRSWLLPYGTSFFSRYDPNTFTNYQLLEAANNALTDSGDGKIYFEFNPGDSPNEGNWIKYKWTWEDPIEIDGTYGTPRLNFLHFVLAGSTDLYVTETVTWETENGTRVWIREHDWISPATGTITDTDDPVGMTSSERLKSLTYTVNVTSIGTVATVGSQIGMNIDPAVNGFAQAPSMYNSFVDSNVWDTDSVEDKSGNLRNVFGLMYNDVAEMKVNYESPSRVAYLGSSEFSTSEAQALLKSTSDEIWTITTLHHGPYDGLWLAVDGATYGWKENDIVDLSTEVSKNGDIDALFAATWNLRMLETLQ